MKIPDKRSTIVLGSHRSGTSVLTRALAVAGVYLGESLIGPRSDNLKGFFEDQIANQLDDVFFKTIHRRWDSLILTTGITPEVVTTYHNTLKEKI